MKRANIINKSIKPTNYDCCVDLKKTLTLGLIICIAFEFILHFSAENIYGCIILFYCWTLVSTTVIKREYMLKFTIPFLMLFSYAVCFFILPLLVTLIEGKPLSFRFKVPYITFTNLAINCSTIVAAFHVSRRLYRQGFLSRIWKSWKYFKAPTDIQIWTFGFIGLFALFADLFRKGTESQLAENLNFWGQLNHALIAFSIVPIALLFPQFYKGKDCKVENKIKIWIYLSCLTILAIASTVRQLLVTGVVTYCILYILDIIRNNKKMISSRMLLFAFLGVYLVTGPLADIATAMALQRTASKSQSFEQTFSNTLDLISDKEKLHYIYNITASNNSDNQGNNMTGWSEYYVDNIIMDRLCNLRVQDLTLDYATHLGYNNHKMHKYMENFFIYLVPTPLLNALGYTNNKFEYAYTPGDMISTEILSYKNQYKGYRIAGDSGIGLYWLGYTYYIFAFIIYILVFYFLSSLIMTKNTYIMPIPVMITVIDYFWYFNNSTGILRSLKFLLRTGLQGIIIYILLFAIIRKITK